MNLEHYRQKLLAREKELEADIAAAQAEARVETEPEVQDEGDFAIRSTAKDAAMSKIDIALNQLEEVRAALRRIDDGTYGTCLTCGKPIDEKRLEAIPWAAYDVQHQKKVDHMLHRPERGATL